MNAFFPLLFLDNIWEIKGEGGGLQPKKKKDSGSGSGSSSRTVATGTVLAAITERWYRS